MSESSHGKVYRARLLFFTADPYTEGEKAWQYYEDGALWIKDGLVYQEGNATEIINTLPPEVPVHHFPNHLITPGFIDTHIHYPQTEMIAAYGAQLLDWLNTYTFPTEQKFSDPKYCTQVAKIFLDELLRNGTTTALVFGTVHPSSVDAFFHEAQRRRLRMIAGKVLMDRNAPPELCDSPAEGYTQSAELIERWHKLDRLQYAVTPRFAPTSSDQQLHKAGELLQQYPDVYLHTHLAENQKEVAWVQELFPTSRHYLDVYDQAGLLGSRSVFAHGVHLCDNACERLAQTKSAIAHCPTSNMFLGSGLINLDKLYQHGVQVAMGTDVGAGTSFSLFRTMDEAYKVQQLRGATLDPMHALYLATLGGAVALDIADKVGSLQPGWEADFVVIDLAATPLLEFRTRHCANLRELIFVLNTLADDRAIEQTYSLGRLVHERTGESVV